MLNEPVCPTKTSFYAKIRGCHLFLFQDVKRGAATAFRWRKPQFSTGLLNGKNRGSKMSAAPQNSRGRA
jgi:hypothetical protein